MELASQRIKGEKRGICFALLGVARGEREVCDRLGTVDKLKLPPVPSFLENAAPAQGYDGLIHLVWIGLGQKSSDIDVVVMGQSIG
jgi:hypothetical protein